MEWLQLVLTSVGCSCLSFAWVWSKEQAFHDPLVVGVLSNLRQAAPHKPRRHFMTSTSIGGHVLRPYEPTYDPLVNTTPGQGTGYAPTYWVLCGRGPPRPAGGGRGGTRGPTGGEWVPPRPTLSFKNAPGTCV